MTKKNENRIYFIMLLIFFFSFGFSYKDFNKESQAVMANSDLIKWGLSFKEENAVPVPNFENDKLLDYNALFYDEFNKKNLYLTFDAGFENGNTQEILSVLKKHNITAIFFLVSDYIIENPSLTKDIIDNGHIIGNHTHSHPHMYEKNKEDFTNEILNMEKTLLEYTNTTLEYKFYRPPMGRFTIENLEWANDLGYNTVFWSVAYVDWDTENQPSYDDALKTLYSRVHDGAIILLHPQSTTNTNILDEFITTLIKEGYYFAHPENLL